MIGRLFGLGQAARQIGGAVGGVAEVFVGNQAKREAADHERYIGALGQFSEEFKHPGLGWFDRCVNGLNRLPRPTMALGTLGLFVYAMVDPPGFSERMQGLGYVPEPLWWLLGAIVSFYFGARELHYYRYRKLNIPESPQDGGAPETRVEGAAIKAGGAALGSGEGRPSPQAGAAPAGPPNAAATAGAASPTAAAAAAPPGQREPATTTVAVRASDPNFNAAFEEWRAQGGR